AVGAVDGRRLRARPPWRGEDRNHQAPVRRAVPNGRAGRAGSGLIGRLGEGESDLVALRARPERRARLVRRYRALGATGQSESQGGGHHRRDPAPPSPRHGERRIGRSRSSRKRWRIEAVLPIGWASRPSPRLARGGIMASSTSIKQMIGIPLNVVLFLLLMVMAWGSYAGFFAHPTRVGVVIIHFLMLPVMTF